jgi:hypothetical protein
MAMADDADWWAKWRKADFSWSGLKAKDWEGYSVLAHDGVEVVAETETREIYRVNSPSALRLQAMRLDEKGVLQPGEEPPPQEGAFLPETAQVLRKATLQDYTPEMGGEGAASAAPNPITAPSANPQRFCRTGGLVRFRTQPFGRP